MEQQEEQSQEGEAQALVYCCNNVRDTERFMRLGAEITEPGFVLCYNNVLGEQMYAKQILYVKGGCFGTTNPISVTLCTDRWRWWRLGEHKDLFIAYDPDATHLNAWWMNLKKIVSQRRVPDMFGSLVVFRYNKALEYNELELRRELINFLITRYKYHNQYKFFEKD